MSSVTFDGAHTRQRSAAGSRPASSAARRAVAIVHSMIAGSASWMITPSADAPGDAQRARAVRGHVERDLRLVLPPT